MAKRNFLLGKGERLTEQIRVPSGPVNKAAPYTFAEAKARLQPMLDKVVDGINQLPADACPDDYAIATITLNPEYIAKTYYPSELLRTVGLDAVGSRSRKILPEKRSNSREPQESVTTELFVRGKRNAFNKWANELPNWVEGVFGAIQIIEIEEIAFPTPANKIKEIKSQLSQTVYEVVLHSDEGNAEANILNKFRIYLSNHELDAKFQRRFYAGGLCFLELEAPTQAAVDIAQFSLVRVVREMPSLRLLRPPIRSAGTENSVIIKLPNTGAMDPSVKAVIFDGGIPENHPICKWVNYYEAKGLGSATKDLYEHGVGVTSAFLFGHINPKEPLPVPYANVDHYRVLDDVPGENPFELYEVLERITSVLVQKDYSFVNLSLGPNLPIEDDEIHAWTAVLDEYLSDGKTLLTVAVGNDGEGDAQTNLNRVQVPSDCVNALSIGACDVPDNNWQRAPYSSVGPGRSPGLIKPDLVDFGGSLQRPFLVLDAENGFGLAPTGGTSFSSPSVLRLGAGIRAHFGNSLSELAIRTLLIHSAENAPISKTEIGWGRVARNLNDITVCEDHVVRVVFQGSITASKFIRAPIPLPNSELSGKIKIKATLCYATNVDPHHSGNYTRSGIEITFRPSKTTKRKVAEGESEPLHAQTKPFFSKSQKAYQTEEELRRDAWKWENCLHAENQFLGKSLNDPVFDIHYNARLEGHNDTRIQEIQYALVITVEAPRVGDLYNQVVRRYATQLEQLQPLIDIPIKV